MRRQQHMAAHAHNSFPKYNNSSERGKRKCFCGTWQIHETVRHGCHKGRARSAITISTHDTYDFAAANLLQATNQSNSKEKQRTRALWFRCHPILTLPRWQDFLEVIMRLIRVRTYPKRKGKKERKKIGERQKATPFFFFLVVAKRPMDPGDGREVA